MLGDGGQGSPHLPEPGDSTSRCIPHRPLAPPGRMPLSAEPAKVTSAHSNLINKTMRQGSHYTLIRDDRTGRSCPELSSIPASSSQPGPGRGWGGREPPASHPGWWGGPVPGPKPSQPSQAAWLRALRQARVFAPLGQGWLGVELSRKQGSLFPDGK